ncbi:MAG TPA: hypothetical protein DFR83_01325 [Deltaproteobacteria bacterium]|nr:hypothetical protein [Deltaproteobacteria bacterium]
MQGLTRQLGDYTQSMDKLHAHFAEPYPADWTVRQAVAAYLQENGFPLEDYDKPWVQINIWSLRFPFPNPPSRQLAVRFHDLHHVVTGYGTDPCGEAEISAWETRRGVRVFSWFVRSIVWSGFLFGMFHSPRRTLAAWKAGHGQASAGLQPVTMARYQELLDLDLGALRQIYGLPTGGIGGARALHSGAPSPRSAPES